MEDARIEMSDTPRRKKRRIYTSLLVDRVDLVDRGANFDPETGDGSHIVLTKRDTSASVTLDATELQKQIDAAVAKAMAERAAAAVLAASPTLAARPIPQEQNMSIAAAVRKSVDSYSRAAADVASLDLAKQEYDRLPEDSQREVVAVVAADARTEARKRGVSPRSVLDDRVMAAAAVLKNARPALSFDEAIDAARAMTTPIRLASREVHGER